MKNVTPNNDPYIEGLEKEKSLLIEQLDIIKKKISTINTLITKQKASINAKNIGIKLTKKNSNKLFFEEKIKDTILKSTDGLRTSEIYNELIKSDININYNTFRVYISNMRSAGVITKNKKYIYNWILKK